MTAISLDSVKVDTRITLSGNGSKAVDYHVRRVRLEPDSDLKDNHTVHLTLVADDGRCALFVSRVHDFSSSGCKIHQNN